MKIELEEIKIRELIEDFYDDGEDGVVGYGGKLDIRPPFQREFIYEKEQQEAVIDTVIKGHPLNSMYWAVRRDNKGKETGFEIIDGQQRTLSICHYVANNFSDNNQRYFTGLSSDEQEEFLDYELMVYQCRGEDSEKLKWFETINIAGKELTPQELRNALYACRWLADAKSYFSKQNCGAQNLAGDYLRGAANRQEYLEIAIRWHSAVVMNPTSGDIIREYMALHHKEDKPDASELIEYFEAVIEWVKKVFIKYRPEMRGQNWGDLHHKHKDRKFDSAKIEAEVAKLMDDEDVTSRRGIYEYVLTHDVWHLNIRKFSEKQRQAAYEKQKGICKNCKKKFPLADMEADHIDPWSEGGKTIPENCQMLCRPCNRRKSDK